MTSFENPAMILGLMVALLAAMGLAAFMFWGKLKKRIQGSEKCPALLLRRDPKVEQLQLEVVDNEHLVNHETRQAWLMAGIQRHENGTIAGVVITNDSCIPQFVARTPEELRGICETLKRNDPQLCHDRAMEAIERLHRDNPNTRMGEWMGVAVNIAAGSVGIMGIVILATNL